MKLSELLAGQEHHVLQGDPSTTSITAGATFDVDRVTPGSVFVAVPGHREGGPASVAAALARGAAAVLVEETDPALPETLWPAS
ncbi:UDP-N-acetylmuramoyl-L-alanyl-D-glutamate--2,6-diaminopimelate ligase, partial [Streptomyces sp. NPDC054863]